MTKNGIFLMLPKEILQNYLHTKSSEDLSALIDYLLDYDNNTMKINEYYFKKWGFGKGKTLRIISDAKNAIENMRASHYFNKKNHNFKEDKNSESGCTSKNIRTKNGRKADERNHDNIELCSMEADEKLTKSGRIYNTKTKNEVFNKTSNTKSEEKEESFSNSPASRGKKFRDQILVKRKGQDGLLFRVRESGHGWLEGTEIFLKDDYLWMPQLSDNKGGRGRHLDPRIPEEDPKRFWEAAAMREPWLEVVPMEGEESPLNNIMQRLREKQRSIN